MLDMLQIKHGRTVTWATFLVSFATIALAVPFTALGVSGAWAPPLKTHATAYPLFHPDSIFYFAAFGHDACVMTKQLLPLVSVFIGTVRVVHC